MLSLVTFQIVNSKTSLQVYSVHVCARGHWRERMLKKRLSVWVGIRTCLGGTCCVDSLGPWGPLQPKHWPLSISSSASTSPAFTSQIHLRLSHLSVTFTRIYSWLMRITQSRPALAPDSRNSQPEWNAVARRNPPTTIYAAIFASVSPCALPASANCQEPLSGALG